MDLDKSSEGVVRVSFSWLVLGSIMIVALGVLGGLAGAQLFSPRPPLGAPAGSELHSSVQEVTISPSTAAADLVDSGHRSVVLIRAAGSAAGGGPSAAGAVVTNDGLIVTADSLPEGQLTVFDYLGKQVAAEYIGRDALFGLTYLRVTNGVLVPFDLRADAAPVGYELLAMGRSSTTLTPKLAAFRVLEHSLPPELMPEGVRLVLRGPAVADAELAGAALVDDEGRLAGLMLSPAAGLALPGEQLRESIDRVVSGKREANALAELGLTVRYAFAPVTPGAERRFVIEVTGVTANSPAQAADFARGDLLLRVADQTIEWQQSALSLLSRERPFTVTVQRGEREETLTVPAGGGTP